MQICGRSSRCDAVARKYLIKELNPWVPELALSVPNSQGMLFRNGLFFLAFLTSSGLTVSGQNLSVGIVGGGSLTNAFETINTAPPFTERLYSQSKDFVAGGMIEYRFRPSLSIELDGMYRELHLTFAGIEPDGTLNSVSAAPVVTWEFPILGKYRFHWSRVNPFIEAGPALRTTGNLNANPSHYGVAAGLGVEAHWRGLDIAPVIRYTRWARDNHFPDRPESKSDQIELLVGISGRSRINSRPMGPHVALGAIVGTNLTHDFADQSFQLNSITVVSSPGGGYTFEQVEGTESTWGAHSFIGGPMLELSLPRQLSIELNALYHPLRSSSRFVGIDGTSQHGGPFTEAITWEFPVLAKCKWSFGSLKPFAEAGPSFRLPQEVGGHLSTHGVTAGAGVETHWRGLKIAPAIRFTHWGRERPAGFSDVRRNQIEFLTGFSL